MDDYSSLGSNDYSEEPEYGEIEADAEGYIDPLDDPSEEEKPENTKKTRGEQYIYVNNRFIRNGYLNHAIINSYEGLIEDKKFPFYVLFISINTDLVDINIHPTKTEIKFEDEKLIYNLVKSSVKKSLEKFNVSPSLNFDADVNFTKNIICKSISSRFPGLGPDPRAGAQIGLEPKGPLGPTFVQKTKDLSYGKKKKH